MTINTSNRVRAFESRFSLKRMFRDLDRLQDLVVFGCAILLVFEMMMILVDTFINLGAGIDVKEITAQSLFLLILVELFRLLAVYLEHHRIFVSIAVEVAVVSVLREIIVEGLIHMDAPHIFAICSFLFVLGGLMFISHKVENLPELH
ncbi:MAG: phosphate-starvation-inducible PsiE family protein [Cyanobacteria bacterium P01_G01_bin.67]